MTGCSSLRHGGGSSSSIILGRHVLLGGEVQDDAAIKRRLIALAAGARGRAVDEDARPILRPDTEAVVEQKAVAHGGVAVAEGVYARALKRSICIDINKQIMRARGASELCTLIEAQSAEFNQVVALV